MGIIETIKMLEREEAREEARKEVKTEVVKNLLAANKFTVAEIANFANITEAFVKKVRKELS